VHPKIQIPDPISRQISKLQHGGPRHGAVGIRTTTCPWRRVLR